jgi:aspartyl/glutamyl-tRNA(Asn/Gln) amidotransferase C subunit
VKGLQVSSEELKNASWDARIELTQQEEKELQEQLHNFFMLSQAMQNIDLNEVEAFSDAHKNQNILRKDIVEPSLPLKQALENAPDTDTSSFHVPRIIEE